MEPPLSKDRLFDLYKIAVDEYRFEVRLGWDRAMYYLIFNTAIVSVATGLLKLDNPSYVYVLIGAVSVVGFGTSIMGVKAIEKSHEYYRRTIVRKTLIEDLLGLASARADYPGITLAVGTTVGHGDTFRILGDTENWISRPLRRGSVMFWIKWLLVLLAAIDLMSVAVAGYAAWTSYCKDPGAHHSRIILVSNHPKFESLTPPQAISSHRKPA